MRTYTATRPMTCCTGSSTMSCQTFISVYLPPLSSCSEQVCLASSDLLHTHLALAGTKFHYYYRRLHLQQCDEASAACSSLTKVMECVCSGVTVMRGCCTLHVSCSTMHMPAPSPHCQYQRHAVEGDWEVAHTFAYSHIPPQNCSW